MISELAFLLILFAQTWAYYSDDVPLVDEDYDALMRVAFEAGCFQRGADMPAELDCYDLQFERGMPCHNQTAVHRLFGLRDWQCEERGFIYGRAACQAGRVVELYVLVDDSTFQARVGARLSSEIGRLAGLTSLVMQGIGGTLPTQLGKLTALTELAIFEHAMAGKLPSQLALITNLTNLDLTGSGRPNTGLRGTFPVELSKRPQAYALDFILLAGNRFVGPFANLMNATTNFNLRPYIACESQQSILYPNSNCFDDCSSFCNATDFGIEACIGMPCACTEDEIGNPADGSCAPWSPSPPPPKFKVVRRKGAELAGQKPCGNTSAQNSYYQDFGLRPAIYDLDTVTGVNYLTAEEIDHYAGDTFSTAGKLPEHIGCLFQIDAVGNRECVAQFSAPGQPPQCYVGSAHEGPYNYKSPRPGFIGFCHLTESDEMSKTTACCTDCSLRCEQRGYHVRNATFEGITSQNGFKPHSTFAKLPFSSASTSTTTTTSTAAAAQSSLSSSMLNLGEQNDSTSSSISGQSLSTSYSKTRDTMGGRVDENDQNESNILPLIIGLLVAGFIILLLGAALIFVLMKPTQDNSNGQLAIATQTTIPANQSDYGFVEFARHDAKSATAPNYEMVEFKSTRADVVPIAITTIYDTTIVPQSEVDHYSAI